MRAKTEIAYHAEEQLSAALQLVAALVLTDEEVAETAPDARPGNLVGWAESTRKEMLDEHNRPKIVAMLKRRGYYTNTHIGFPLASLSSPGPRALEDGLEKCRAISDAIRDGSINYDLDTGPKSMTDRLVHDGMRQADAEWIVRAHGTTMFLLASMDRVMGRTK